MRDVVIRTENLGKLYRLGKIERYRTLRDTISDAWAGSWHRLHSIFQPTYGRLQNSINSNNHIWALKEVSFEVKRGDVVGIIGRNGAGKSTLMKILSRITEPTEGYAEIKGRIGSLLEVGTGFHPELSGRENIYLNGAILGMKKAEIRRKFDDIVVFAEVEKFIDTPVKHYSSGMYVRLAFAVAAHLEPEILLVDEVLAVGDAAFQKKCLGKMGDVAKEGRTILFVSHNMQAISTLTQRCLLLSRGKCVSNGPTAQVIADYLQESAPDELIYTDAPSSDKPKVTRVEVRTSLPNNVQVNGQPMEVHFEITTPVPVNGASLSFQALNSMVQPVLHLWTFDSERPMCRQPGRFKLICRIPKTHLYLGQYRLKVHFSEREGGNKFQGLEEICPFEVVMYGQHRDFKWVPGTCTYVEDCEWEVFGAD